MDSILDLLNVVIKIALFGGGAFIAFNVMRSKKFNSVKTDVQNLEAKLAQLRLALKGKVKKKSNVFRAMSKTAIIEGDLLDTNLKNLCDVKFESSEDFQRYFDISKQLVSILQIESNGEGVTSHMVENSYMSNDFKTEMDIVRIIKEMTDLSSRINARIDEHNRTGIGQKLKRIDTLTFPSMTEVNRIFKSDETPVPKTTAVTKAS